MSETDLLDELDRLRQEVAQLRLRAERKHCPKGCGHDQHYLLMEIACGPLPDRTIEGPIAELMTSVADLVMSARDDVDMSAVLLSAAALGYDGEEPETPGTDPMVERLQAALAVGNQMMGAMSGHASLADERLWLEFELALAGLVNDGLLADGEAT